MVKKPVIYKYIQNRMIEETENLNGSIDLKKAKRIVSYFGIPKHLTYKIIKEMEELNMIRKINLRRIRVKKS